MSDTKQIIIIEDKTKRVKLEKPKKNRIVRQTFNWKIAIQELDKLCSFCLICLTVLLIIKIYQYYMFKGVKQNITIDK